MYNSNLRRFHIRAVYLLDPKHLLQLAVIIELGSLTKAAQKLNTTQPSLSRLVKSIENRVGGAVLRRDRHGVAATEIGLRLAEEGRRIMQSASEAETAVQKWRHGLRGELRVGLGPMLATTVMGEFLTEIIDQPLGYALKVHCEHAARLLDRLQRDELDVVIMPYELNRREGDVLREPLFQDRLAVFVGHDDPLANQSQVLPTALAGHHWIAVGEISGLFNDTRETLARLGLHDVTPTLENTGDVTITFRLMEKTRSCSLLPFRVLHRFQDFYRIAPVDLTVKLPLRNVGFWARRNVRDRPECLDFHQRLSAFVSRVGLA